MQTMKAIRAHRYGDPSVLVYEDVPRPAPVAGEALIKIHGASVNPADWKVRQRGGLSTEPPYIPGWDISGVIEEINGADSPFKIGDEVYGMLHFPNVASAYAEYATAPFSHLDFKPRNLSHVEAAAVPLVALTVWQALFDIAQLSAGQSVLIQAAAGGVGHVAVQLAKWKGAHVIGTASARNADFVREMGADEVIDYTSTRLEDAVQGVDVILDSLGEDALAASLKLLKPGGIAVSIVDFEPPVELAQQLGVRVDWKLVEINQAQLQEITKLIEAGQLKPVVSTVLPLAEARQAHELSEGLRTRGKIVLTPNGHHQ